MAKVIGVRRKWKLNMYDTFATINVLSSLVYLMLKDFCKYIEEPTPVLYFAIQYTVLR